MRMPQKGLRVTGLLLCGIPLLCRLCAASRENEAVIVIIYCFLMKNLVKSRKYAIIITFHRNKIRQNYNITEMYGRLNAHRRLYG